MGDVVIMSSKGCENDWPKERIGSFSSKMIFVSVDFEFGSRFDYYLLSKIKLTLTLICMYDLQHEPRYYIFTVMSVIIYI